VHSHQFSTTTLKITASLCISLCAEETVSDSKNKLDDILNLIKVNQKQYAFCVIRAAIDNEQGEEELSFCRIDFQTGNDRPADAVYDYGNFKLIQKSVGIEDAIGILTKIKEHNSVHLDNKDLKFQTIGSIGYYFIPSDTSYALIETEWPTHYFYFGIGRNGGSKQVSYRELPAKPKIPYYTTKMQAVVDFAGLRSDISNMYSEMIVVVQDFRAKIKELTLTGNELNVEVTDSGFLKADEIIVKFYCKRGDEKRQYSQDVKLKDNKMARFVPDFEPDFVDAVIVDLTSCDTIDKKSFGGWHGRQKGVVIRTPQSHITEIIAKGESSIVEFKTSLRSTIDILQTIVSFANTEGGMIIVGVDDRGNPRGFYEDGEAAIKSLTGLIHGNCDPVIEPKIERAQINGIPILIIRIPEGKDKPYILADKGIYIREGASDRQIDRRRLNEMYEKKLSRH